MKKAGLAVLTAVIMGGALWADSADNRKNHSTMDVNRKWVQDTGRFVPLQFGPSFKQELKPEEPSSALKQMRTIQFEGDEGLQGAGVSFYESKEGYFMAFLTDSTGVKYHLENAPGMEVEVRKLDPGDPIKAIVLSDSDTDFPRKMVIRRNTATGAWESWDFQGHTVQLLHIGQNLNEEWVGFDPTAVPPMTELYRWNRDKQEFEGTSAELSVLVAGGWMDQEIPCYSFLFRENGQWLLEIGQERKFRFYRYENEGLREVELPDNGSSRASRIRSHEM